MPDRILLIEDDARLAEMVKNYLGGAGFHVTVAPKGATGIALEGARGVRRRGARPDAARHGRPRNLPAHPRARRDPDPDADRARRADGPRRRARNGRRRLSRQAVRAARAAGAAARRSCAAARADRRRTCCASAGSRSTSARARPGSTASDAPLTSHQFALLLALARHPGRVMSRDALMELVQERAARSVRPLDRRAHLAHPRRDRGRCRRSRGASSRCAAPATCSPRIRADEQG